MRFGVCLEHERGNRCGGNGHETWREASRNQAGIGEMADSHRQVPALLGEVDDAVIETELHLQLRMTA